MNRKEQIVEKLKENGCRITKQRRMLIDIILENDCSSCKEIFYKASRADEKIGVATVYRMINDDTTYHLTDQNWNRVVQEGLKQCGYLKDQKIAEIKIQSQIS